MAKHSPQYLEHARSINGRPWTSPHPYIMGVAVTWHPFAWHPDDVGKMTDRRRLEVPIPEIESPVRLVCLTDHYAGDQAEHPWDPGYGWPVERAALMWVPDGEVEAARLSALLNCLIDDRAHELAALVEKRGESVAAWVYEHVDRLRRIGAELLRKPSLLPGEPPAWPDPDGL